MTVLLAMEDHQKRVGQRVAQRRDELGMTQEALAQKAGMAVKTISRFENGRHEGRLDTIKRIAEALDMSREELVGTPPAPLGLGEQTQLDRIEAKLDQLLALAGASPRSPAEIAADAAQQRQGTTTSSQPAAKRTRQSDQAA